MSQKGSGNVLSSKKMSGRAMSMPAGLGIGLVLSILSMLIQCGVLSWLALEGMIGEEIIGYAAMTILFLSSMTGAAIATFKIKRRKMLVCLLTGALFLLFLVLITAIFFKGCFSGLATTVIVTLAGSVAVGVFGLRQKEGYSGAASKTNLVNLYKKKKLRKQRLL